MRLTEFTELMTEQFGTQSADSILVDHVLIDFGGRTGAQAIDDGIDPRDVWVAICRDFDVPRHRW
ncbi:DUF3046 domain-containing protein [Gordonia sp. HNM0687]|uniref:DUF3046 domain-containing protein n=1 Tax=Gordonia mangrovi TaxID=2665643 RepID=A0A6L7GUN8_9ACTN|nr:DUF3046 domain-containing protein [Gordonia mangrovi]MDY6811017.1 DUF3046 domain-containing protein [Actinomycetota bacterium]MXP22385.1 DUF3046 domain-containing protein [Gordonia mangrovi]UVF77729.1 DUF3046 domain-containing protein [Gordonia mangrovi]